MVSVVDTTTTTTVDNPADKVSLPTATIGRPVRAQPSQGSLRVCGGWGWAMAGYGGRAQ